MAPLLAGAQLKRLFAKAKSRARDAVSVLAGADLRAEGRRRRASYEQASALTQRNVKRFLDRTRKTPAEIAPREDDPAWITGAGEIEHPSRVLKEFSDQGDGVGTYFKRMLDEPMLDALWTTRTEQVIDQPWAVEPRAETPAGRLAAAVCEQGLEKIENLDGYLTHMQMSDYYGCAFAEPHYVRGPLAGRQNLVFPTWMHLRPMDRFAFVRGGGLRVRSKDKLKKVPWGHMFVKRSGDTDSPWGDGKAENQHTLWGARVEVIMAWLTSIDRHWLPPVVATIDGQDEDLENYALEMLQQFAEGADGLIEKGEGLGKVTFRVLDHRGSQAPFGGLVRNLDVALALSTLGAGDVVGLSQEHGSHARAEVGMQIVGGRLKRLANSLARHIECTLFRTLTAVNVGPHVPVPRLKIRTFTDSEILDRLEIFERWIALNRDSEEALEIGQDFFRQLVGYPKVHFTDKAWNYTRREARP